MTTMNFDDSIEALQQELDRRLNHAEGDTEEERTEFRKRAFEDLSSQIIEVQCQKRLKEAEASSAGGSSTTTNIAEQAVKISISELTPKAVSKLSDQLRDYQVRAKKSHSKDQVRMMFSEMDRLEVTQSMKTYRFPDGAAIDDAANWMSWNDNEKLAEFLKLLYPTSEAISDVQRILQVSKDFKIYHVKNPRHLKTFVAHVLLALQMEDRSDELMGLSATAYQLLQDALLDQVMGKYQEQCAVTKDLINCIKAKAPSNLEQLFEAIVEEGEALHRHAVRSERMNQPFLPYKQKEGTKDTSKDIKSKDQSVKGGGTVRKACTNCGKYHDGVCNAPKRDTGNSSSSSSSSNSSSDNKTSSKFDKWKKPKKGQSSDESINLHNEIQLNNLSENNHSCVRTFIKNSY